ncbi:MAG: type III-B CRISPR module-associated protein Cmr5 [Ardenticatenaceae bacterium]|nr:type III-B CRISPR module-associated protein Cmr5 [Ardenticatenaceae bacterium]
MSEQRMLEQRRAEAAWDAIQAVKRTNSYQREYKSLARSAPADIHVNGLGQTLAFWRANAKKKAEHRELYNHVSRWVMRHLKQQPGDNLLEWVSKTATTDQYRQATTEAMAFLLWLKRFAEAELEGEA